jgi:hypothetical protein
MSVYQEGTVTEHEAALILKTIFKVTAGLVNQDVQSMVNALEENLVEGNCVVTLYRRSEDDKVVVVCLDLWNEKASLYDAATGRCAATYTGTVLQARLDVALGKKGFVKVELK